MIIKRNIMLIKVLKSKAKALIVTDSRKDYSGSLILDPEIIEALNMIPYEHCEVNAIDGMARISTYVVPGNKGDVIIAGGASNHISKGERIHVNCFGFLDGEAELYNHVISVVYTDENNKITNVEYI